MTVTVEQVAGVAVTVGERLLNAAIILVVGSILAGLARRFVHRVLERPGVENALGPSMVRLISGALFYLILGIGAGLSLIALGVPTLFVLTISALIIVVLGLALQQSVSNFAASVIFMLFQPFKRGDIIATMGYFGTVREILLFSTVLLTSEGRLVSLPNSKIQENGLVNYSWIGHVQADFTLRTGYGESVDRARAIMTEIAAHDERVLAEPAFRVIVEELGENGVLLHAYPSAAPQDYWAVRNYMREQIKARFDTEGIKFAVPRRDLHIAAGGPAEINVADLTRTRDGQTAVASTQQTNAEPYAKPTQARTGNRQ
jgi:small conductance mechanosensitive channel